jgi:hypothetical protein
MLDCSQRRSLRKLIFDSFSLPRSEISVWGDLLGLITVSLTTFGSAFSHLCFVLACFILKYLISFFDFLSVTKNCIFFRII